MSLFQALVLGLVQGLTEFLPVSSSGHLTLVPFLFGWETPSLEFDVAVHLGTLGAVVWFFRDEVRRLWSSARGWKTAPEEDRRVLRLLAYATVPAAVIGVVFESPVEEAFDRPVLVAFLLGVTGYFLMASETVYEHRHKGDSARAFEEANQTDAWTIGIAQAVAILPGISRSGATIGAGMRRGLDRAAAARFSFLMSIPIIAGAIVTQVPDIAREADVSQVGPFIVGIVTSAVSGFFAVRWFLGLVARRGLRPFGVYCWVLMMVGLLVALARG